MARHLIGNDAFQEVDIVGITRSITKYGVTVSKREDLGRIIKEAFYIARTGRPGPVLIDLPKDVMSELVIRSLKRVPIENNRSHSLTAMFAAYAPCIPRFPINSG